MSATPEHAIAQEAGAWLFRLRDDRSEGCRAEFSAWLRVSPQHVAEFLLATATDLELGALNGQEKIDVDALLADSASNVLPLKAGFHAPANGSKKTLRFAGLAAAALLILTLPLFLQSKAYRTDVGEQRAIKLEDGSVIQLNTRSAVKVDFSAQSRLVQLTEGEALFNVEQDKSRPFEVQSGSVRIQVIGTQFNVYRQRGGVKVSVVEGKVKILAKDPLLLSAGQEATVGPNGLAMQFDEPQVARSVSWRQRHLEFQSATVAEAAAEFNRYNRMQIRIASDVIAQRRMSGMFKADEPQSLLDFLANEEGVKVRTENGVAVLYASGLDEEQ